MGHGRDLGTRDVQLVDAEQRLFIFVHPAPLVLDHIGDNQHVGAVALMLEPLADMLGQHGRGEGAEGSPDI